MHSIWLTFDPATRDALCAEVEMLATKFDGPLFEPHLTLVGEIPASVAEIAAVVENHMPSHMKTSTPVKYIGGDMGYFMSFFLAVSLPSELKDLREKIASDFGLEGAQPDPAHISLAYGCDDALKNTEVVEALKDRLIDRPIQFGQLCIVHSACDIPIKDWKVLRSYEL